MRKIPVLILAAAAILVLGADAFGGVAGPSSVRDARPTERAIDAGRVERAVLSKKVSVRLQELGYSADKIMQSLDELTDDELAETAENLEAIETGGDIFFSVLVLLLIVALIIWLSEEVRYHRYR